MSGTRTLTSSSLLVVELHEKERDDHGATIIVTYLYVSAHIRYAGVLVVHHPTTDKTR
jgi:hypothetical protein